MAKEPSEQQDAKEQLNVYSRTQEQVTHDILEWAWKAVDRETEERLHGLRIEVDNALRALERETTLVSNLNSSATRTVNLTNQIVNDKIKQYSIFLSVIAFVVGSILTWVGIEQLSDLASNVVNAASERIEPTVEASMKRLVSLTNAAINAQLRFSESLEYYASGRYEPALESIEDAIYISPKTLLSGI